VMVVVALNVARVVIGTRTTKTTNGSFIMVPLALIILLISLVVVVLVLVIVLVVLIIQMAFVVASRRLIKPAKR
jgi:hypothetical protein